MFHVERLRARLPRLRVTLTNDWHLFAPKAAMTQCVTVFEATGWRTRGTRPSLMLLVTLFNVSAHITVQAPDQDVTTR